MKYLILVLFIASSCSLFPSRKFPATKKGLKTAIKSVIDDINFCSTDRLSKDNETRYTVRVRYLIKKTGEVDKVDIFSKPQISYGVDNCLRDSLESFKFHPPKRKKAVRISQTFKLKAL